LPLVPQLWIRLRSIRVPEAVRSEPTSTQLMLRAAVMSLPMRETSSAWIFNGIE
jgi:hypothetical protein